MQFLESSVIGLRMARWRLASDALAPTITLYPMVHVGEVAFYARVYEEALAHDVVLVEGVGSEVVRRLTRSYRWLGVGRLGLVLQPKAPLGGQAERVPADLTAEEFEASWARIPAWRRALVVVLSMGMALVRRIGLSRARLAKGLDQDDLTSRDAILGWAEEWHSFLRLLGAERDARLAETLDKVLTRHAKDAVCVAVVYGAAHMPALVRHLQNAHGYRPSESEWLTIFGAQG